MPDGTLWKLDAHTEAKHLILRKYLDAWLAMLTRYHKLVIYVDGFSGPGEYLTDDDRVVTGSPVIALRAVIDHKLLQERGCEFRFIFIDEDKRRIDHLRDVAVPKHIGEPPKNVKVWYEHDTFEASMRPALDALDEKARSMAPTFVLVDPFGIKGVPMSVLASILKHDRTEVLVTLVSDHINRFLEQPEFEKHLDELFGTTAWRTELPQPPDRLSAIPQYYETQLSEIGGAKYVRSFRMINKGGHPIYDLVFGTNSVDGVEKMKAAMWGVDPVAGGRFSDRTAGALTLFEDKPDLRPLREALLEHFAGKEVIIEAIERFVTLETPYDVGRHLKKATLKVLEDEGKISGRFADSKRKRRKGTYPPGTFVKFD